MGTQTIENKQLDAPSEIGSLAFGISSQRAMVRKMFYDIFRKVLTSLSNLLKQRHRDRQYYCRSHYRQGGPIMATTPERPIEGRTGNSWSNNH